MATFRIALVLVCLMAVGATMTCPDGADSETCSQLDAASLIQLPATATVTTGLAPGRTPITCSACMELLRECFEWQENGSEPVIGATPCEKFASALLSEPNGGNYKSVLCILGNSECGNTDSDSSDEDILNAPKECTYQAMAKQMPDFEMLCGSDSDDSGSDDSIEGPPVFTQQEATRKLKGDVSECTNPNKDDPATWACPCLGNMRIACNGANDEQACFKCLMCQHSMICGDWKDGNCDGFSSDSNCAALLVQTNTSMEARAKEARVEEETPSQALDEALSGKCKV